MKKILLALLLLVILGGIGFGSYRVVTTYVLTSSSDDQMLENFLNQNGEFLASGSIVTTTISTGESFTDTGTNTTWLLDLSGSIITQEKQKDEDNERDALYQKRLDHYLNYKRNLLQTGDEVMLNEELITTTPPVSSWDNAPASDDASKEDSMTNEATTGSSNDESNAASLQEDEAEEIFDLIEKIDG